MKNYQFIIVASLLLTACVDNNYRPIALDSNFGRSVKQISQAQLLNPQAAANPSQKVSKKFDGQTGQNVIRTYRNSFNQQGGMQGVNVNAGSNSNMESSGQ